MPSNSDRPFGHDTLKIPAVFVPEDAKYQASRADITRALGYDAVKFPAVFVPAGAQRPGHPYVRIGRAEFRPAEAPPPPRVSGSWRKPVQASEQGAQEDDRPGPMLPRTRYRFGAARLGGANAGQPPNPVAAVRQRDPVAAGIAAWRGTLHPGQKLRQSLAPTQGAQPGGTLGAAVAGAAHPVSPRDRAAPNRYPDATNKPPDAKPSATGET